METLKRIFFIGILSLLSLGMFVGSDAKAAPNLDIKTYRVVTTDNDVNFEKKPENAKMVRGTIFEMGGSTPIGTITYNYNLFPSIPVDVCMKGEPCYHFTAAAFECIPAFVPFSPVMQNLWSDWYNKNDETNAKTKCRCMNEYLPIDMNGDGIPDNIMLSLGDNQIQVPYFILDGILQIGPSALVNQLFP